MIYAAIQLKDGTEQSVNHWLRLRDNREELKPPRDPLLFFMSYSFSDSHLAKAISEALSRRKVQVYDPSTKLRPGEDWSSSISKNAQIADVAVLLATGADSEWLNWEIQQLLENDTEIIPLLLDDRPSAIPSELKDRNPIKIKRNESPDDIASRILDLLPWLKE